MMVAAMLAMMLAMIAAPALAQNGDVTQNNSINCSSDGGTAIASANGGDVDQILLLDFGDQNAAAIQYGVVVGDGEVAQVIIIEQNQQADAVQYGVAGNGGVAIADASGGDVLCTLTVNNGDIVTGDSVEVGRIVFEGDEVTVFKDEANLFFIIIGQRVVPVNKQDVIFAGEAGAANAAATSAEENATPTASATAAATTSDTGLKVLPETSGVSLITLGSGVLLLVGGLIARRIVR
jgi:hypothetical protein